MLEQHARLIRTKGYRLLVQLLGLVVGITVEETFEVAAEKNTNRREDSRCSCSNPLASKEDRSVATREKRSRESSRFC